MNQVNSPSHGASGTDAMPMDAARLAALLLKVYALARESDIAVFQQSTLALLRAELYFDSAWWGRSTVHGAQYRVHCSSLYNLPPDTPQRLNLNDPGNLVARRCLSMPDRAHWVGPQDWQSQPSSAQLAAHMGVEQVLCIARLESPQALVSFLALSREPAAALFEPHEYRLLECLMPHLVAAMDLCCATEMARLRQSAYSAFVMTDQEGWLRVAEPLAGELFEQEWPGWGGARLPETLQRVIEGVSPCFVGRRVHVDVRRADPHLLIEVRPRLAKDVLSVRERHVADAYASGQSYKQVALELGMAPSTVRHHLRSIYMKLGVNDKAELTQCLWERGAAGPTAR